VIAIVVGAFLLITMTGCIPVRPPAEVKQPVTIYLADYGIHSSVMLPSGPDHFVEYSFGDYAYSVKNYDWPWNALAALLISMQSSLGRNVLEINPANHQPIPVREPKRMMAISAERANVEKIVTTFDQRYRSGRGPEEFNAETNTHFMRDSEHYAFYNNCNHMAAGILRDAGCSVYGWGVFSNFYVIKPAETK
jgi:hypothetical protein